MKRAENALRYQRLDRALEFQMKTAQSIDEMGKFLQSASEARKALSTEELSEMLQSILKNANKIQNSDPKK